MSRINFTLGIEPQSWQFAGKRAGVIQGKIRFFKDARATAYNRAVSLLALASRPRAPLQGPLCVEMFFVLPRPQALDRRDQSPVRQPCPKRPDAENLAKATIDALTETGFWRDDAQITRLVLEKWYAARGESPCIEVAIEPLYPDLHPQDQLF